jgi:hypothetical protein
VRLLKEPVLTIAIQLHTLRSVLQLLVTANVVTTSLILSTLIKEAIHSSTSRILQRPYGVTSQKKEFFKAIMTCFKIN